jgi:hypothetical protein
MTSFLKSAAERSRFLPKRILFIVPLLFILPNISFAWSGYDLENSQLIEIDSGNLVREGLIIEFFDNKSQNYYYGKVLQMEYSGHYTELKILQLEEQEKDYDIEDNNSYTENANLTEDDDLYSQDNKKIRTFLMQ